MGRGVLGGLIASIALIHKCDVARSACHVLPLGRQLSDLSPILGVGGGDMQGEQMVQGIDGHMYLAAPFTFSPVIPRTGAALRCRLQRPALQDGR
jgi:hypothetical protein